MSRASAGRHRRHRLPKECAQEWFRPSTTAAPEGREKHIMFQFTDLVRGGEAVREIKQRFPETAPIFDHFGLRPSCDDCSIEMAARKAGAAFEDLLVQVNAAIYKNRGVTARAS